MRSFSALAFALSLALSLVFCATADAGLLFYDNFQSDAAGTDGDFDPVIGTGDVGSSWEVFETDALLGQVRDDAGNNYLCQQGADTASLAHLTSSAASSSLNQKVRLSFSTWVPVGNTGYLSISAWADTSRSFNVYFAPPSGGTSAVSFYDGVEGVATGLTVQTQTWQDVVVDADMLTKAITFTTPSGTWTYTGGWNSDSHSVNRLYLPNTAGSTGIWDNIRLDVVPEPGSLSLLAVSGLVGMLAYAWRKRR
jgi:hypothetical protein